MYPFHPASMVDIKNDTRLKLTSTETTSWLEDLSKYENSTKTEITNIFHAFNILNWCNINIFSIKLYKSEPALLHLQNLFYDILGINIFTL